MDTPVVLWNVQIVVEITCVILECVSIIKKIAIQRLKAEEEISYQEASKQLSIPNNAQLSSYADKMRGIPILQGLSKLRLFLLGQTVLHILFSFLNLILKKSLLLVRNPRHQAHRKPQIPLLLSSISRWLTYMPILKWRGKCKSIWVEDVNCIHLQRLLALNKPISKQNVNKILLDQNLNLLKKNKKS